MPEAKPFKFNRLGKEHKPASPAPKDESVADMQGEIEGAIREMVGTSAELSSSSSDAAKPEIASPIGPIETGLRELEYLRKAAIEQYGGKRGYNPYIWCKKVLDPLAARIKAGDTEAIKELMEIDVTDVKCSLEDLDVPYGEDKGVFANNPRAQLG